MIVRKVPAVILIISVLFMASCSRGSDPVVDLCNNRGSELRCEACAALEEVFGATELPEDRDYPGPNDNMYYVSPEDRNDKGEVRTTVYMTYLRDVFLPSEGPYGHVNVLIHEYEDESTAEARYSGPSDGSNTNYSIDGFVLDGVQVNGFHGSVWEGDTVVWIEFDYTDDLDVSYAETVFEFCDEVGIDHPDVSELFG